MSNHSEFDVTSGLFAGNGVFADEAYARYLNDPNSVDASWRTLFAELGDDYATAFAQVQGASWAPRASGVIGRISAEDKAAAKAKKPASGGGFSEDALKEEARYSVRALMLVRAYRVRGHLAANLDPLRLGAPDERPIHEELDPASYGFTSADYDRPIFLNGVLGMEVAPLREIVRILRQTYCRTIGVEFMHLQDPAQKSWLQKEIEGKHGQFEFNAEEKKEILKDLVEVEAFEQFLQLKFSATKRFSVQGGDSMVPGLEMVIMEAARLGVKEIVIGMPHRGRMNVLTTVMGKPYVELLSVFHGNMDHPEWLGASGDVKYHLGVSTDRTFANGREVHLSLTANPSHLEAVNPVVAGKVRAKQRLKNDTKERASTMGVLLHGDAAFAGQGLVAETLALVELNGYKTGGSIHIIVNNQIGFTTAPKDSRSTPYPSDVAKGVQAPIFHVNGDDPEAVVYVCKLAAQFRQLFKRDVVVDVFCYRKYGHNESDEPMFTQPLMYKAIKEHKLPAIIYGEKLVAEGTVTQAHVDELYASFKKFFEEQYAASKNYSSNTADWLEGQWSGFKKPKGEHEAGNTGVARAALEEVGQAIARLPKDFDVNPKLVRLLEQRRNMIESGEGIDWGMGEALAFGTLLKEGYHVRLSGQDCIRGTFSHRHSELVDQTTEQRYRSLNHIADDQAYFEVINSNLSEFAVMGFEYGYSLANPNALVMWEAQFGDFANGAQVILDQFISSGESKWLRMSGVTLLLPHGHEGQGPEHSSARPERYLSLCAEDNMQVVNCTTPANFFHVLRRQLHRDFRKPLIVFTPKSLLRHKLAVSSLKDFEKGTNFQRVIPETDELVATKKVRRVVFSWGKIYYDLLEARREKKISDIALVRVEQLYPYPAAEIEQELARYPNAEFVWCQEETKNDGPWSFIAPLIEESMESKGIEQRRLIYVGRAAASAPASGYMVLHQRQQKEVIDAALASSKQGSLKKVV
ncbi:MAG: 2-oxoglutarate dehydrogenase E1 component [Alphaproteobacteria bacterium]|nr:2-oxoglutarate dehydrogenase E1 component [Alphaproteobacteria bacterium]